MVSGSFPKLLYFYPEGDPLKPKSCWPPEIPLVKLKGHNTCSLWSGVRSVGTGDGIVAQKRRRGNDRLRGGPILPEEGESRSVVRQRGPFLRFFNLAGGHLPQWRRRQR